MIIGQRIGYARVSSIEQNTARQLEMIGKVDKSFIDYISGKGTNRHQLEIMMQFVRDGDTVVVSSFDRLARNLSDLLNIVQTLTNKGVTVSFVSEGLTFTGDDQPMPKFMMQMMGAVAEFERTLIKERQRQGIAIAKTRGIYKGRKKALNAVQIKQLRDRAIAGESKSSLAAEFKITRQTVYQYMKTN